MKVAKAAILVASMVLLLWSAHLVNGAVLTVEFFWGEGCPHCEKVKPLIEDLSHRYSGIEFRSYEVYGNQANARLLLQRYAEYDAPNERGVPVVLIGRTLLLGDQPIIDSLENVIISELALVQPTIQSEPAVPEPVAVPTEQPAVEAETNILEATNGLTAEEPSLPIYDNKPYSLWAITGAAVVDSINPCAIAVLLILLTALMLGAGEKKRALLGGLAFTVSIYITYFLFGLGLLQLINVTNLAGVMAKIVGVVAVIIGLANIKDFFFYGAGGFVMEIPRSWRPTLKKILSQVTSPLGAFLAGFVVTLFELPCTGGPYFFVIGLLAQARRLVEVLPALLYYNLVFVLPLLLIVFAVYFGFSSVQRAEAWKERNIRRLHLVGGLIMLALGVWVFYI